MNCDGCGAELVDGAKRCGACRRAVGLGHRAEAEMMHAASETGPAIGNAGHKLVGGLEGIGSRAKKEFKRTNDEPQGSEKQ
jgi:hypothetical protein